MGKSEDGKVGEDGLVATASRKHAGRWQPGQSGNPRGRAPKAQELAILDAIRTTFPPEVITEKLSKALELAERNESARGIVAVLEFAANYTLGKPVQRIQQSEGGIGDILDELGE